MANLARIELLIDGTPTPVTIDSEQPTTSLKATRYFGKDNWRAFQDSLRQNPAGRPARCLLTMRAWKKPGNHNFAFQ